MRTSVSLLAVSLGFTLCGCQGEGHYAGGPSSRPIHRVSPESPRDAALDQDAQEQDAEAPESGLEDAGTDAASDASSPPEEASCNTIGRDVRFNNDVILPFASDRDGLLLTATIVSAFERGRGELYASEPYLHQVSVLRGCDPYCEISVLSAGLVAPLRATPVDFDGDGDRDVLVADIGLVQARVDLVGRVVLLVNEGSAGYRARVLLDGVGRVACAEPADLDNDGDIDVSVCEFGAKDGSLSWLERTASGGFQRHILRSEAGTIHAYPFDADADGDLDLGVALSQKAQQVLLYRNQGGGQFSEEVLYQAANERFGLSGIELDDLDRDGDTDILVAAGDYQDDTSDLTQHGLYFLRNDGSGRFAAAQRLSNAPGVQTVKAIDLDDDCDTDLVLGSLIVPAMLPPELASAPDLIWLENDGMLSFEPHTISGAPKQLTSLAAIHVAGSASLFAGSFSIAPAAAGQERLTRLRVY